ncbi:ATP-binding protein [Candidatus Fermentibacteria bacterium]|nr:ATP-binding protein [Candidatus Fermentibacteria bacterium]
MIPFETFLARADQEAGRYGDDPWVFLRELVQNSRDAHARHIEFTVTSTDAGVTLVCEDDGVGMNGDIAERYLLRLYASTKGENGSVGFFGVGFWSILRFNPRTVTIMSRSTEGEISFELDVSSGTMMPLESALKGLGTRVVITREPGAGPGAADEFEALVRERLLWYAAHVRPFPGEDPIELTVNGERLDREFPLPPHGGRRIRGKGFSAVVGFGSQPSVKIYTSGILVRDLVSLDEVIPSHGARAPRGGWGLYPVVKINADGLRLLMDRQAVYEDEVLKRAVRRCETELLSIHRRVLHGMLPMDLRNLWWRMRDRVRLLHVVTAGFFLVTLVAAGTGLGSLAFRGIPAMGRPSPASGRAAPSAAGPKTIDCIEMGLRNGAAPGSEDQIFPLAFLFDGPPTVMFIARFLTGYDQVLGFQVEPLLVQEPYPSFPEGDGETMAARMYVAGGRNLVLPVPPGHGVVARSVLHEGLSLEVWRDRLGQPVVVPPGPGWVSYSMVRRHNPVSCSNPSPTVLPWSPRFRRALASVSGSDIAATVESLAAPVRESFVYARADATDGDRSPWLERALSRGTGDCDVINGVMALLLRSAGIEAHLAVGIIGEHGRAVSPLHAVTAYCDSGWRFLDLSTAVPSEPLSSPDAPAADHPHVSPTSPGDGTGGRALRGILIATITSAMAVLGISVLELRTRRAKPDPSHVRYLFGHLYDGRDRGTDLAFRPVVPLIGGRRVSLYELERMASRGPVLGAKPGAPLLSLIRASAVIDGSADVVGQVEPFLPPITWLDDLDITRHELPPFLSRIEHAIAALDPAFRIYLASGAAIRIVEVPLRDHRGDRHVFLGREHPLYATMEASAERGVVGLMEAAARLMRAVPTYVHCADRFLEVVAKATHPGLSPGATGKETHG